MLYMPRCLINRQAVRLKAAPVTYAVLLVDLYRLEDANKSLRRQLEEKSDIISHLQSEIQQLVDRINSMEAQHSVELGMA